jgi:MOB kinase activator 1
MASFINTMFVHSSPPQTYSQSPKPLPALHSNILAESESYIHLQCPLSPQAAYRSPLQKQLQHLLHDSAQGEPNISHTKSNIPIPFQIESCTHDVHRGQFRGLGQGLKDIVKQADLVTCSNNNARTRNQAAFQPAKRAKGTNSWQLKQFAEATLGGNSLRKVVQLPEGEDRDEWLAVNSTKSSSIFVTTRG